MGAVQKLDNNVMEEKMEYLIGVWKDIIIKYSNNTYYDLRPHLQETVDKLLARLQIKTFAKNKSISSQLDRPVVTSIIKFAVMTQRVDVLDSIYKRTRSSMFQYFHYKELTKGFALLGNSNKSLDILNYMLSKPHYAYWYAVYNLDNDVVKLICKDEDLKKKFNELKETTIIKLLESGEKLEISLSKEDLLKLASKMVVQSGDFVI